MRDDYTPTTEEVRQYVGRAEIEYKPWQAPTHADAEVEKLRLASFDRWLAEHDREVAQAAWDQGFIARLGDTPLYKTRAEWGNPNRQPADIEPPGHDFDVAEAGDYDTPKGQR